MKKLLMFVAILGIITISGSVFYYYVIFLPKQTTEIRKAVAPTPQEFQSQLDEYIKAWGF